MSPSPTAAGHTTSTYTHEGLTLLSLDATSEEGTAAASWRIDYLTDATGRPYGGIYTSSETSAVAFGIVTTDRGDVRELTYRGKQVGAIALPFARYDHDAYGNPTRTLTAATAGLDAATAAAIAERNILRYAGYAFDQHSGLYYLSQRYYDPATCQFITKDPAKADGEESAYQYCGGDPVGKVDPSGEYGLGYTLIRRATVTQKDANLYAGVYLIRNVLHWPAALVAGRVRKVAGVAAELLNLSGATDWLGRWGYPKQLSVGDVMREYRSTYAERAKGLIGPSSRYRVYGKITLSRNGRTIFSRVWVASTFRCKGKNLFISMKW